MQHVSAFALLFAAAAFRRVQSQSVASVVPVASAAQASSISQVLSPSFAGVGIEPSNLFSFTGDSQPNNLSITLLQNLADYAGAPPHVRIGGNTGDYMIYDASYQNYTLETNPLSPQNGVSSADLYIFGPGYLEALDRFPTDTPVTYGLNLAYDESDYLDKIVTEASAVLDVLTNVKVYSFEIGNEPDLYLESWNSLRNGTWDGQVYTQQWLERAAAVYQQVLEPKGIASTFFEAAQTASTIGTTFTINDLVQNGIAASVNGSKYLSSWNQHDYFYFIGVSTVTLTLNELMNLDNTASQFKYWTSEVSAALKTGLPYNLREMASVGPVGMKDVSDTFGASLWTLNFFLYAAALNISSVQMHMTDNSYASPWSPITRDNLGPHVRPSYYAFAAFAQLVGASNATTQVSFLPVQPSNSFVRAYSAYTQGSLSDIIIINAQQVNASASSKGNETISISLPEYKGQTLYLSYLTAGGADSTQNATWNGISFEQDDIGTPTTVDQSLQTAAVGSNGIATVTVRDSQAVIAHLGSLLGSKNATVPSASKSTSTSSVASSSGAAKTSAGASSTAAISSVPASGSASGASASASAKSSGSTYKSPTKRGIAAFCFVWTALIRADLF
ncbi:hypothetical protein MBLNU459_g2264t1 [Dothideomycetes sp. NU459]